MLQQINDGFISFARIQFAENKQFCKVEELQKLYEMYCAGVGTALKEQCDIYSAKIADLIESQKISAGPAVTFLHIHSEAGNFVRSLCAAMQPPHSMSENFVKLAREINDRIVGGN